MKRINIFGLSSYGFYLAKSLSNQKAEIVTVDMDEELTKAVTEFVHRPLIGDATKVELLRELHVDEADYNVVSLGQSMEASILCTLHLKELKAKNIITKANNIDHAKILMQTGADQVVFPEKDMAEQTAEKLLNPEIFDFFKFTNDFSVIQIPPPISYEGKSLKELNIPKTHKVNVVLINNVLTNIAELPVADYVIKSGDVLYVLGNNDNMKSFKKLL